MPNTRIIPLIAIAAALLFAATDIAAATGAQGEHAPVVVFLVRHAEKVDSSRDAALSPAGEARAQALAVMLRDAGITQVHSTDYRRTRDTASPAAEGLGLAVSLYDPRALQAFADALRGAGGRHLVVGHSNTTPALVEALGGDPGTPIREADEYDRLYLVTVGDTGEVDTLLLRYGATSADPR